MLACIGLGFAIPFVLFPLLRALKLPGADAAALAAHYGSVSVVIFAVATAALWVAVMEAPGLVAGILLARWSARGTGGNWRELTHDVLFGKSVLLLLGGLAIGAWAGEAGTQPIEAVFVTPFKGVLALFLLVCDRAVAEAIAEHVLATYAPHYSVAMSFADVSVLRPDRY